MNIFANSKYGLGFFFYVLWVNGFVSQIGGFFV